MKCPHCQLDLERNRIYRWYTAQTNAPEFVHPCPDCRTPINIRRVFRLDFIASPQQNAPLNAQDHPNT